MSVRSTLALGGIAGRLRPPLSYASGKARPALSPALQGCRSISALSDWTAGEKTTLLACSTLGAIAVVSPPAAACVGSLFTVAHLTDLAVNDDMDDLTSLPRMWKNQFFGPQANRKRVVVLGSGWGALAFVRKLDPMVYDVTLISPRNYFFYTPLLAGVSTSTVKAFSVLEPVRQTAPLTKGTFIKAQCTGLDPANKIVKCEGSGQPLDIPYDHLLISVGAQPNTFGIPGVQKHAMFLKELDHAKAVRQRILERLEEAEIARLSGQMLKVRRLLSMVVVGGGPTGVEFAAELADFVAVDVKRSFPRVAENLQITLVEALPCLLNMFVETVGTHVKDHLQSVGVDVLTQTMVKEVSDTTVTLQQKNGEKSELEYGVLVWVAGVGARPISKELGAVFGQSNPRGIEVDECLRVKGSNNNEVFAFGDCAVSGFALTAQVASQQGKYLGRAFRDKGGAPTEPFEYNHQGTMAYVGQGEAVATLTVPKLPNLSGARGGFWRSLSECPGDIMKPEHQQLPKKAEKKTTDFNVAGLFGFGIWRGVYFAKLFSYKSRFNVGTDWLRTIFFGRTVATPLRDKHGW
eukprot:gnl/TRDRNA2_/TRDRNA2_80238_c0_seq2.p1 gnl/TRDRNA2_/TRDRNA2_80238_c0~~gnl/TRDRNA2_/TRDRNA2_80238_c0_seq2.p1  ORF type:complete len:592 (+),score=86.09 gnl/TRDRNA2_/TRDRNA2_80238_c0_seq2:51-1778(+)